jgi:prephenate dehydratase
MAQPPEEGSRAGRPRVAYLGPEGTFSEQALLCSVVPEEIEPVAVTSIYDAVMAAQNAEVELALVPIENSVEGSVTVTLDTLTGQAHDVRIVGELILAVHHALIVARDIDTETIERVYSHPHVPGQCTRLLHSELAHAEVVAAGSTAEAVRIVAQNPSSPWAAIGTRLAAEIYGARVLREGVEDHSENATRFVWLARDGHAGSKLPLREDHPPSGRRKTSLVFWGEGAQRAGWLVCCLDEFARRDINLTKIESRPQRERLGRYMFFLDLDGSTEEDAVSEGIEGLAGHCEQVRVMGSYPAA